MFELSEYERLTLGEAEQRILHLVAHKDISAYDFFSFVRDQAEPISYKNVHKTFKKLEKLELIEVASKFKRNAIYYKLTTMGVFQILLTFPITISFLIKNKHDPILNLILFQFFAIETIRYFDTIPREYFITEYLKECCSRIVEELRKIRKFNSEQIAPNSEILADEIMHVIAERIKLFIYTIVTVKTSRMRVISKSRFGTEGFEFIINKKDDKAVTPHPDIHRVITEERMDDPNYSSLFPIQILKNDKTFMPLFLKMKDEFEGGCRDFK